VRDRLSGGASRLERIGVGVPDDLARANDLLVGRLAVAENAVTARYTAASSGDVSKAWEASSAAAAAAHHARPRAAGNPGPLEPPKLGDHPSRDTPGANRRSRRLSRGAWCRSPATATFHGAFGGANPLAARDRLIVVPTRAGGAHLLRTIENRRLRHGGRRGAPGLRDARELPQRFAERISTLAAPVARRAARGAPWSRLPAGGRTGAEPPFRLRPGLIAEILRFYDTLRRHRRDVDTFARLALGMLEPGADIDRGAERLVRQTRFLVAAFRAFEARAAALGWVDEHVMRRAAVEQAAARPWRQVIVAVGDRSRDSHGCFRQIGICSRAHTASSGSTSS